MQNHGKLGLPTFRLPYKIHILLVKKEMEK